MSNQLSY
jgi:hypothetical protein